MGGRLEGLKKEPAPYVAYFAKRTPFCNVLGGPYNMLRSIEYYHFGVYIEIPLLRDTTKSEFRVIWGSLSKQSTVND